MLFPRATEKLLSKKIIRNRQYSKLKLKKLMRSLKMEILNLNPRSSKLKTKSLLTISRMISNLKELPTLTKDPSLHLLILISLKSMTANKISNQLSINLIDAKIFNQISFQFRPLSFYSAKNLQLASQKMTSLFSSEGPLMYLRIQKDLVRMHFL